MTERLIQLKHQFFRYGIPGAVELGVVLLFLAVLIAESVDWRVLVTVVSAVLSSIYLVQKQRLEELHLFKELFEGFNHRYDCINEQLAGIAQDDSPELQSSEVNQAEEVS